jgi:hypothetical protein
MRLKKIAQVAAYKYLCWLPLGLFVFCVTLLAAIPLLFSQSSFWQLHIWLVLGGLSVALQSPGTRKFAALGFLPGCALSLLFFWLYEQIIIAKFGRDYDAEDVFVFVYAGPILFGCGIIAATFAARLWHRKLLRTRPYGLIYLLNDPTAPLSDRDDAAMDLGEHNEPEAEVAVAAIFSCPSARVMDLG